MKKGAFDRDGFILTMLVLAFCRERSPEVCAAHLDRSRSLRDLRECRLLLESLDSVDAAVAKAFWDEDRTSAEGALVARQTWQAALVAVSRLDHGIRHRGIVRLLGEAYACAESVRQDPERTTLIRRMD